MAAAPHKLTLRAYNVGFGDCFLLTFHYARRDRHLLIDFGSTSPPRTLQRRRDFLLDIAEDIAAVCGGRLDAVVATHRHKDHISGFATKKNGKGAGDLIRALKPRLVIMPWTEDPDAAPEATVPVNDPGQAVRNFIAGLHAMHVVAAEAVRQAGRKGLAAGLRKQLSFLGEENLPNRSAVENLLTMGAENRYVYFGAKSGLEKVLPGVKVHVLGPPTLKQSAAIRRQRSKDPDEFWHFAAFWAAQAGAWRAADARRLFPQAASAGLAAAPLDARWLIEKIKTIHAEQLLAIVRALDKAMNNTSLILLFEAGGKRFLFPGDAQIENWLYALSELKRQGKLSLLEQVNVYKVGHHGSLNATPKSLWALFKNRGGHNKPDRLASVLSTKPGVHGEANEVPRRKLVEALEQDSHLHATHLMRAQDGLCRKLEFDL